MKDIVGFATNESRELILGNVLIGIGGFLLGLLVVSESLFLILASFPFFGSGIVLDVRVLKKFSYDLSIVKGAIKKAQRDLAETKNKMQGNQYSYSSSSKRASLEGRIKILEDRLNSLTRGPNRFHR